MLRRMICLLCLLLVCMPALAQEKPEWCLQYDDVIPLKCDPPRYLVQRLVNGNYCLLDAEGNVIQANYVGGIGHFYEGIAIAYNPGAGGATAFIREDGELITGFIFDNGGWGWLRYFNEGLCSVRFDENDLCGCINAEGEIIIEPQYDFLGDFSEGLAFFRAEEKGLYGYINPENEIVIAARFHDAEPFHDGRARVQDANGLFGYIDPTGEMVIPAQYADAGDFSEGLAWVENTDGGVGFIRTDGSYAVDPEYIDAMNFQNGVAPAAVGTGVIDHGLSGEPEEIRLWGLVDAQGKVVLPFEYDWAQQQRPANLLPEETVYTFEVGDIAHYFRVEDGRAIEVAGQRDSYGIEDAVTRAAEGRYAEGCIPFADLPARDKPLAGRELNLYFEAKDGMSALVEMLRVCGGEKYGGDNSMNSWNSLSRSTALIFSPEISDFEKEYASYTEIDLECVPVARDALVFIVPRDHPLDDISMDQLRDIYSGQTAHWSQLGAEEAGKIIAYQWRKTAWVQQEFEKLMQDIFLMDAPTKYEEWDYGDVALHCDFRATPGAIGFCMNSLLDTAIRGDVKVLSIDGVYPTFETIADGSYPAAVDIFAAYDAHEDNPNVQIVLDWLRSDQGREMLQRAGYAAYGK